VHQASPNASEAVGLEHRAPAYNPAKFLPDSHFQRVAVLPSLMCCSAVLRPASRPCFLHRTISPATLLGSLEEVRAANCKSNGQIFGKGRSGAALSPSPGIRAPRRDAQPHGQPSIRLLVTLSRLRKTNVAMAMLGQRLDSRPIN
jgi:hypothetical protein